jgi:UDP-N-acetylmuramate dehydrogenase
MQDRTNISLKPLNTFQVEARAARYVRFDTEAEIFDFTKRGELRGRQHLILGAGSNLLFVGDFAGVVLHPLLRGIEVAGENGDHVRLRAMAGENWDDFVAATVASGWGGLENLSWIPGSVGASAVQNIGAYGVEVRDFIDSVEAISLGDRKRVAFAAADCGFGYRHSRFKGPRSGRYLITAVVFRLMRRPRFVLDYPGVRAAAERLGPLSLETLRRAVIAIRKQKLPDPAETGNAGSFFKNPVIEEARLKRLLSRFPDMPSYPQGWGQFKIPAAWMIERCGWKGRAVGRAAVHEMHALVLVNRGGAAGREILDLSERVRRSVLQTFGVNLTREVAVVGLPEPS